jgi:hypothetical protein
MTNVVLGFKEARLGNENIASVCVIPAGSARTP